MTTSIEGAHTYCPVCGRGDILIKKDGTLRAHVDAQLLGSSFLRPNSGRCEGSGHRPRGNRS